MNNQPTPDHILFQGALDISRSYAPGSLFDRAFTPVVVDNDTLATQPPVVCAPYGPEYLLHPAAFAPETEHAYTKNTLADIIARIEFAATKEEKMIITQGRPDSVYDVLEQRVAALAIRARNPDPQKWEVQAKAYRSLGDNRTDFVIQQEQHWQLLNHMPSNPLLKHTVTQDPWYCFTAPPAQPSLVLPLGTDTMGLTLARSTSHVNNLVRSIADTPEDPSQTERLHRYVTCTAQMLSLLASDGVYKDGHRLPAADAMEHIINSGALATFTFAAGLRAVEYMLASGKRLKRPVYTDDGMLVLDHGIHTMLTRFRDGQRPLRDFLPSAHKMPAIIGQLLVNTYRSVDVPDKIDPFPLSEKRTPRPAGAS